MILAAVMLAAASAGCGAVPAPPAAIRAADPMAGLIRASRDLGPTARSRPISVVLDLTDPSAARRAQDLAQQLTPGSPGFGLALTPAQYSARYGAGPATVAAVRAWLARVGLAGTHEPGTASVIASGAAATVERAFAISLHDYLSPAGIRFFAAASAPRLPASLGGLVTGIGRITDYRPFPTFRAVPSGGLKPLDVARAYDIQPLRDLHLDGSGETVVIWGTDGHLQSDLDAFTAKYGLPPISVESRWNTGVKPNAGGEETMDIEVVHAIAPAAKIVVYTPRQDSLSEYTQTIDAITADNPGAIQSHSWGLCEATWGADLAQHWLATMQRAAQQNETVFVASGDRGGFECPPNDWSQPPTKDWLGLGLPDAIPYVTSVGGTRISVSRDGSWYDETVWVEHARNVGSTGGVSRFYTSPSWVHGPGVNNSFNKGQRMEPDVSADSDPVSGMSLIIGGKSSQGGGTSQAAPMWAGITALMNQYLKSKGLKGAGFLNPALYSIAAGHPPYPAFHDITVGNNMNYPATPGYDLATGLGTPDVWNLVRDLEAYQRNGGRI